MATPPPPPGFVLETTGQTPPPPPGFVLESQQQPATPQGGEPTGFGATTGSQFLSGVNEGIGNTLGLPVDLANTAISAGIAGVNKLTGSNFKPIEKPTLGSEQIKEALAGIGVIGQRSRDRKKQIARRVGQGVGEAAPFIGSASSLGSAVRTLVYGAGSGAGAATAQQIAPNDPTAELIGSLLGGLAPAALESTISKMQAAAQARKAIPTSEQLKATASGFYDEAERVGFTAKGNQTQGLDNSLKQVAQKEGLVTPRTGTVVDTMPKVKAVLKMTEEFAGSDMTPSQMQSVRRTLQNAAQSADGAEARVGAIMLERFDNFTANFAPQFKQARSLYHRSIKAETLEKARELAGARAGQFTGSGFENALRTEYRNLDRKLIKGELRGFTDAEKAAVKRVARGTFASNAARNVGRFAPTGPVGGIAVVATTATAGGGAGGALIGLGFGGRALATRLGIEAADTAELLVRAGVLPQKVQALSTAQREALAAVLAAQLNDREASTSPERP